MALLDPEKKERRRKYVREWKRRQYKEEAFRAHQRMLDRDAKRRKRAALREEQALALKRERQEELELMEIADFYEILDDIGDDGPPPGVADIKPFALHLP